ncbi:hypothetical protein ACQP2T_05885 [Nonomuraea sp. CA-143628]|uniref:hypothetical protein n=1 Tax=Nonomuraea sp. CA-143628 TaxID=3239997 RepID=UPI003D8DAB41
MALTVAVLATGTPGSAHAAVDQHVTAGQTAVALDPVAALKRQFVKGRGVRITVYSASTAIASDDVRKPTKWSAGVVEFGTGGVMATDLTHPSLGTRYIQTRKRYYEYDKNPALRPPKKKWILIGWQPPVLIEVGHIRVTDPVTLKAVLSTTARTQPGPVYDGTRTTLYEGVITFAELRKAYPKMVIGYGAKPEDYPDWTVSWKLWIGKDQLVRRAWSAWREPNNIKGETSPDKYISAVADIRLSRWGMKLHISPPPADQVITAKQYTKWREAHP